MTDSIGKGSRPHARLLAGIEVPADDDVALHTDVVLPVAPGRHPVMLLRTPYGTSSHLAEAFGWARRGVAMVVQDVRGRYGSGGLWSPWSAVEGTDGAATVRWIIEQSWSTGHVVAYGSSYGAYCAVEVARQSDVALAGVVATVPAMSAAHTVREPSGVQRLLAHAWFWPSHGDHRFARGPLLDLLHVDEPDLLRHLPVDDLPARLGVSLPSWAEVWRQPRPAPVTSSTCFSGGGVPPLLVVGGLYDAYADAAVDLWHSWPGSDAQLVLGSWQHDLGLVHRDRNGDRPRASGHRVPVSRFVGGWVQALLDGTRQRGHRFVGAVEGADSWLVSDSPPGSRRAAVELSPSAAVLSGFHADPEDPHPAGLGPVDATTALARPDCSVWLGPEQIGETTAVGAPVVRLDGLAVANVEVGTSFDWMVRLVDIAPEGTALQLGHAAVRTADASVSIVLPPVCHRLDRGHQLAVAVSGHLFPIHPRDPQDGTDPLVATTLYPVHRYVGGVTLSLGHPLPSDRLVEAENVTSELW